MIVGAVLDGQGRPICCELRPGSTADVTTLIPVVDRLRSRFEVTKVCIVADRGMISKESIEEHCSWRKCESPALQIGDRLIHRLAHRQAGALRLHLDGAT